MQWMSSTGSDPTWIHLLPSEEETVNEFHLHEFFRVLYERQRVFVKRHVLKEKAPWTEDPILRDYKFTNVYRELDRNSQWEINNIIRNPNLSKIDLVWQIMLFRIFNRPEFFEYAHRIYACYGTKKPEISILPRYEEYDQLSFHNAINVFRATGENPFTNAYLINSRACSDTGRDQCYGEHIIPTVHANIPALFKLMMTAKDPAHIKDFLIQLPGVANFVAHEFYISFCYVEKYTDRRLFKWNENSWTNVGPGASLGIRLIFPSAKSTKEQELCIYRLRDIADSYIHKHFPDFEFFNWNRDGVNPATGEKGMRYMSKGRSNLSLHQIEMFLCEYQKYWKMTLGVGKQRSKYTQRTN